jgi:hypothetical protein
MLKLQLDPLGHYLKVLSLERYSYTTDNVSVQSIVVF